MSAGEGPSEESGEGEAGGLGRGEEGGGRAGFEGEGGQGEAEGWGAGVEKGVAYGQGLSAEGGDLQAPIPASVTEYGHRTGEGWGPSRWGH